MIQYLLLYKYTKLLYIYLKQILNFENNIIAFSFLINIYQNF